MINRRIAVAALLAAPVASVAQEDQERRRAEEERIHNDWPNLARYREANRRVAAGSVDVVFMGDSITEGWKGSIDATSQARRLNRGIGGQTTPQMLVRFRQDVIALRPRVVHIMAGTNDIAGNTGPSTLEMTQANLMSMTEIAQSNKIVVVLASIPPANKFPWKPQIETLAPIAAMNAWLKRYATERGCIYADYDAVLNDGAGGMRKGFASDGVHPTAEGYAAMNPVAEKAIASALTKH